MSSWKLVAAVVMLSAALVGDAWAGDLKLELKNGRVTLDAKDVSVREILAAWARQGRTTIVNGEKVPGGLVTLQLVDVPERQALDTILRSVSGYMAATRAELVADASIYDRIVVMPIARTAAAPAAASVPGGAMPRPYRPGGGGGITMSGPGFGNNRTMPVDEDDDDPMMGRGRNSSPPMVISSPADMTPVGGGGQGQSMISGPGIAVPGQGITSPDQIAPGTDIRRPGGQYQPEAPLPPSMMGPGSAVPQQQQPGNVITPPTGMGTAVPGMTVQPPANPPGTPGRPIRRTPDPDGER